MSEVSLEQSLESFIQTLELSGLLLDKDRPDFSLDDEDVADMLWLAAQIQQKASTRQTVETQSISEQSTGTDEGDRPQNRPGGSVNSDAGTDSSQTADITTRNEQSRLEERSPEVGSLPIRVSKAPTFLNKLQIRRAFRPLRRKVPSKHKQVLDVEATVEAIAEKLIFGQEVWTVVTKPERERWLDVELVIEVTESSLIWQDMINEFQQILETHGAFRQLWIWNLQTEGKSFVLEPRHRGRRRKRRHHPKELCHPEQRGMILVVSDCTSELWETGRIFSLLYQWSQTTMLGMVQLFPESRWQSTWLNRGRKCFSKSGGMGALNSQLKIMDIPRHLMARVKTKQDLFLPVLTMEPDMIYQWSRVVSGNAAGRIPVYLMRRSLFCSPVPPSTVAKEELETPAELTPEGTVNRFLAMALPLSRQLAGLMSAVPVDINVVNLIRQTLLQKAEPQHVAEVFMGGLMVTNAQHPGQYDFAKGVRKVLNGMMRQDQLLAVLDVLSEKIGQELDRPIGSFMALLTLLPYYSETEPEKILPFARVSVEVLTNLGGEYATFAKQVKRVLPALPLEDADLLEYEFETAVFKEKADTKEIEWKTLEFETVDLIVEDSVTFEFETAKYVGKKLQRETKTTEGLIEVLKEGAEGEQAGIGLEMVRIPAGTFVMGAPESDANSRDAERPQHLVRVPEFYLGRFLVTQEQWQEVASWGQVKIELKPQPSKFSGENFPVEKVSWDDAKEFCARLSQKTGKNYRLPSEAEWEYACRAIRDFSPSDSSEAGSPKEEQSLIEEWNDEYSQPYSYGQLTPEVAHYGQDFSSGSTVSVGSLPANGFGLYDMHGNLWEWCEDDWHSNYEEASDDGSAWIENNSTNKVNRGGAWSNDPRNCRSAYRYRYSRDDWDYFIGFRVACSPQGLP
ncbi:MAG: formylglycine-generating enzyme family protein [Limnothrix sp.]